ncbi:MAG: hypothetical protein ABSA90_01130 [Xanthobacteraceae bacterium]|jgi:hypothetical protein
MEDDMQRILAAITLLLALAGAPAAVAQQDQIAALPAPAPAPAAVHESAPRVTIAAKKMIVCTQAQAASFLAFLAGDKDKLMGSGPASDGRLCDIRVLNRVELGNVVGSIDAKGHHWIAVRAVRREDDRTYEFVVVGIDDQK